MCDLIRIPFFPLCIQSRSSGEVIGYPLQYFWASLVAQTVKESACNVGNLGSTPWFGKIPWRGTWQPTPVFLPEESPWTEEPDGYCPWGLKKSHAIEWLCTTQHIQSRYKELTHWKRLWCWERLREGGEGDDKGWDGWMASPTQWTWVWVDSGSWWWTGRPGYCGSRGCKESDTTEGLNWAVPHQIPLFMGFSRQEYWSGLSCPPGDLPDSGKTHVSCVSALAGRFFTTSASWEALLILQLRSLTIVFGEIRY